MSNLLRRLTLRREDVKLLRLFEQAGLRVVRTELQKGLPQQPGRKLLPVKTYALKPKPGVGSPQGQKKESGSSADKSNLE
jgi:hypothetical protein